MLLVNSCPEVANWTAGKDCEEEVEGIEYYINDVKGVNNVSVSFV